MPQELKKPKTYDEQIKILKRRGCRIVDENFCKQKLKSINYYRLTAYFLPFKDEDGKYQNETDFDRIYHIYEFDRKLRNTLFSVVEKIEVYLRSCFAYYHAHKYGATGYLNSANYSSKHNKEKFQANINREIDSNNKVLFVKHHINKYGREFPIWVISELFTFGMLSYFYNDMKTQDQKKLAQELYQTTPKNVISWLRCCTDLRNICAHYGRLYFRIFPAIPAGFDTISQNEKRRLWGAILVLRALYPEANEWNKEVLPTLKSLFEKYSKDINLYHIAFPEKWAIQLQKNIKN